MSTVRDLVMALLSALILVQFLPRVEPARIPSSRTSQASPGSIAPGILERGVDEPGSAAPRQDPAASPIVRMFESAFSKPPRPKPRPRSPEAQPAAEAEVLSGDRWIRVQVVQSSPQGYFVRFPGRSSMFNQWVGPEYLRFPNQDIELSAPRSAQAWHCGNWYDCRVTKQNADKYYVHYVGESEYWDEWVTHRKVRFLPDDVTESPETITRVSGEFEAR